MVFLFFCFFLIGFSRNFFFFLVFPRAFSPHRKRKKNQSFFTQKFCIQNRPLSLRGKHRKYKNFTKVRFIISIITDYNNGFSLPFLSLSRWSITVYEEAFHLLLYPLLSCPPSLLFTACRPLTSRRAETLSNSLIWRHFAQREISFEVSRLSFHILQS